MILVQKYGQCNHPWDDVLKMQQDCECWKSSTQWIYLEHALVSLHEEAQQSHYYCHWINVYKKMNYWCLEKLQIFLHPVSESLPTQSKSSSP